MAFISSGALVTDCQKSCSFMTWSESWKANDITAIPITISVCWVSRVKSCIIQLAAPERPSIADVCLAVLQKLKRRRSAVSQWG